jgi:hypothetical protein
MNTTDTLTARMLAALDELETLRADVRRNREAIKVLRALFADAEATRVLPAGERTHRVR